MINPRNLLNDLRRVLKTLEDDVRERCESVPEIGAGLQDEHNKARAAERTAQTFSVWRDDVVTQSAAAWVLGCVFVRFLEDNGLIDTVWIAGQGERLRQARDQHTLYFQAHPRESDREYLEHVFREVATLPTVAELFAPKHNPLWRLEPSGDGARLLLEFFQKITPATGDLVHDFADPAWNTRFLGDLYQDLSEDARDKYALLQTPEFVEEFILDRTLTPAIATFGLKEVRLIDPTCGSGHFVLGSFHRLLRQWQEIEPGTNVRALVQRVLDAIHGVDLNPFAIAIARFRLLVEALRACGIRTLRSAPAFRFNLAVGDSLLHGTRPQGVRERDGFLPGLDPIGHVYEVEDADELRRILIPQFHAVVGNPPYITVKDKALNEAYRQRYGSCYRKYSLAVPFMERFLDLAMQGGDGKPAGYVGMIVSNAFMKREFGRRLVEQYIPRWDLTHMIDTSRAYIPGHGTSTVILFGRNQRPGAETIRTVMGIRGEPGTPADPARGEVWRAILTQVDRPGSESVYASVADTARSQFHKHPWSIGGGGAAELRSQLDRQRGAVLWDRAECVGFAAIIAEDDAFLHTRGSFRRLRFPTALRRAFVDGENVRDWGYSSTKEVLFPYSAAVELCPEEAVRAVLWPFRTLLWARPDFSRLTYREKGRTYWEYHQIPKDRNMVGVLLSFPNVATHNHVVLCDEQVLFHSHAPVIVLRKGTTTTEYLELLGLLNCSTACFWMKQVFHGRGSQGINEGMKSEFWEQFVEFDGTKLREFPIPRGKSSALARELHRFGRESARCCPDAIMRRGVLTKDTLLAGQRSSVALHTRMIALQEELDWQCYSLYGITDETLWTEGTDRVPAIKLGERAFEIVLARKVAAGEEETSWFVRHGSTPITEIPAHWPDEYRHTVQRRIKLIESDRNIGLIERPEYKRRWAVEPWDKQVQTALREWLLNRLEFALSGRDLMREAQGIGGAAPETPAGGPSALQTSRSCAPDAVASDAQPAGSQADRPRNSDEGFGGSRRPGGGAGAAPLPLRDPELLSCARLADRLRTDAEFQQVAELFTGRPDFDLTRLVTDLVESDGVPCLPAFRYKPSGLRKRQEWEQVWDLQRKEDALQARLKEMKNRRSESASHIGERELQAVEQELTELKIPVPPKYASADFQGSTYWRLRGKLDVPKERFILYPGCGQDGDPTPVLTWAGWNHLQQARALAEYYRAMQGQGWTAARLLPLLAGLADLLPWLKQWHNDLDPEFSLRMGDYFASFVQEEARVAGKTPEYLSSYAKTGEAR